MNKIRYNKLFFLFILIFIGVIVVGLLKKDAKSLTCNNISQDRAINIVKKLPEVSNYLSTGNRKTKDQTSNAVLEVDSETSSLYIVHVYSDEQYLNDSEMGHAATFNWYAVDKCTGEIKCSLSIYDEKGKMIKVSNGDEYPCN